MRVRQGTLALWFAVALAFQTSTGIAQEPTGPYVWPLDGYYDLSAGFCDYRGRHHHGGIDLSTSGREGIPVRAADSGWVERIVTSYWGYGKAVYLKLTDGRMAVYGHLSEFSPEIQAYVEENQYASKRYAQNLWPKAHELPVKRGATIAKTGQTGAGPPHLHFEIRTGDNKPLNPLKFGFEIADHFAPSIRSVTIVPLQPDAVGLPLSTVNDVPHPHEFSVTGKGKNLILASDPRVTGTCGIAVETQDVIGDRRWSASTYRVRLWVNDVLVTDVAHDSINYDDTRQIIIERLYDARPGYAERPLTLYRAQGNTLWNYAIAVNDGWLRVGENALPGMNDIRIEASDVAGHTTTLEFRLQMNKPLPAEVEFEATPGPPPVIASIDPIENGALITLDKATNGIPAALDRDFQVPLAFLESAGKPPRVWLPAGTLRDTIWLSANPEPVPVSLNLKMVRSDAGRELASDDGHAVVRFAVGDLYQSRAFELRTGADLQSTESAIYQLTPEATPFAKAATFMIRYDGKGDPARLALYRSRGSGRWDFVGNDREPGPMIGGKIDWPGAFALLADHEPPVIRDVSPGRGESTRNKRPTIRFEMFDTRSGIGSDADVILTIDGEWVPVEYDPDTRQAKATPRTPLGRGQHRLEITVKDRVGNEATFLRILNVIG